MIGHSHFVSTKLCPDRDILLLIVSFWRRRGRILNREIEKTFLEGKEKGGGGE